MNVQRKISLVVISSYMVKSGAKLISGFLFGIPAMVADGLHSLFDIVEHIFLVVGGYFARKQDREKYPLDRQPLIDLLGLMVYVGLFVLGISLFWDFLKLILLLLANVGMISWQLPDALTPIAVEIESDNIYFLLIASLVMLGSFALSEVVYKFEISLAKEHRIREMVADATELRSDGWVELTVGLGLLVSWVILMWFNDGINGNGTMPVIPIVNGLMMGGLGIYLMIMAWPEFWENFNNLMNRALDKNERVQLEKTLGSRMPIGCSVIGPLVCYHRGDQLFIKGHLSIETGMMNSADLIVRNAELITKSFFSNSGKIIFSQFSPFFTISEQIIDLELERIIKDAFKISPHSPTGEAFKLLRKGDLEKSLSWVSVNTAEGQRQKLLSEYITAEIIYRKYGADDSRTQGKMQDIIELLQGKIDVDFKIFLSSWLLVYYSGLPSKNKTVASEIENIRKIIENEYLKDHYGSLNEYFLAEAFFSLGFSWERCSDYDLTLSRDLYRKAEYYYKLGGFRSEADRLYNTWGHFETLTYSLGDAEIHLNFAQEIREIKKDAHGLTFTYGCIGDLYARTGNFKTAGEYYNKDIELLEQLKIEHPLPGLQVKKAEQMIKEGLLKNNPIQVKEAVNLCLNAAMKLNIPFFAYKGATKGLLGLSALQQTDVEKSKTIAEATECLNKAVATSPYEKAFWHRLKGRLAGFHGNFTEAQDELLQSRSLFEKMTDPIHEAALSIQAIVSGLETYKWNFHDGLYGFKPEADESLSIQSLRMFINSKERMLGAFPLNLNEFLMDYDLAANDLEKRSEALDRLIWFLEG